jgi:hypothetical protein
VERKLNYRRSETNVLSDYKVASLPNRGKEAKIHPAVKSWLDNVLEPAMVQKYLAAADNDGLAPVTESVQ